MDVDDDDTLLGMPPSMRAKLSAYIVQAASASTMDESLESLATVRTCELGIPPIFERKRLQNKAQGDNVEFVDYELGEEKAEIQEDYVANSSFTQDQSRDEGNHQDHVDQASVAMGMHGDGAEEPRDSAEEKLDEPDNENGGIANVDRGLDAALVSNEPEAYTSKDVPDFKPPGNEATDEFAVNKAEISIGAVVEHAEYIGGDNKTDTDEVVVIDTNVTTGLKAAVSSGDDIFPPSPPHEILIDKNTSIRSNLNDYHTEIDVLDQLIEKYSHSVASPKLDSDIPKPPSISGGSETPPTEPALESDDEPVNSPEIEPAPPSDECHQEETPIDECHLEKPLDNDLVDQVDSIPKATWSLLPTMQEMIGVCCGTLSSVGTIVFENRDSESGNDIDRMSEDSSDHSHLTVQQSVASRVNVGETSFIPIGENVADEDPAKDITDENAEEKRAKGKARRLFAVRKAFIKVFNREQKKQGREQETPEPKKEVTILRRTKQKFGVKRWPWRGPKVHKPKFVDSAFEVSLKN